MLHLKILKQTWVFLYYHFSFVLNSFIDNELDNISYFICSIILVHVLNIYVHHRILSLFPQLPYALIEVWRIIQLLALKLPSSLQLLTLCQVPPERLEDSHYISAAYRKHQICQTCSFTIQPPVFSGTFIQTFPLSSQVGSADIDAYNPFRSPVLKFSVILERLFHVSSHFFLANLSFSTVSETYILHSFLLGFCFSLLEGLFPAITSSSLLLCSGRCNKLSGCTFQALVPICFIPLSLTRSLVSPSLYHS